jgi:hypothetical protein
MMDTTVVKVEIDEYLKLESASITMRGSMHGDETTQSFTLWLDLVRSRGAENRRCMKLLYG